jgi:hypothetical protein
MFTKFSDLTNVERIFRYLKRTFTYGVSYSEFDNNLELVGLSDVNWVGDLESKNSTYGYYFL